MGRGRAPVSRRAGPRLRADPLGKNELLPGPDDRAREIVALLQAVDRVSGIAPVMRCRDRPERVVGLDRVDLRLARTRGGMSRDRPDNRGYEENSEELDEHMFASLERTRVRVKRPAGPSSERPESRAAGGAQPSAASRRKPVAALGHLCRPLPRKMRGKRQTRAVFTAT